MMFGSTGPPRISPLISVMRSPISTGEGLKDGGLEFNVSCSWIGSDGGGEMVDGCQREPEGPRGWSEAPAETLGF